MTPISTIAVHILTTIAPFTPTAGRHCIIELFPHQIHKVIQLKTAFANDNNKDHIHIRTHTIYPHLHLHTHAQTQTHTHTYGSFGRLNYKR